MITKATTWDTNEHLAWKELISICHAQGRFDNNRMAHHSLQKLSKSLRNTRVDMVCAYLAGNDSPTKGLQQNAARQPPTAHCKPATASAEYSSQLPPLARLRLQLTKPLADQRHAGAISQAARRAQLAAPARGTRSCKEATRRPKARSKMPLANGDPQPAQPQKKQDISPQAPSLQLGTCDRAV